MEASTESNGSALAKVEEQRLSREAPQTHAGILTAEALKVAGEQRKLLAQYVAQQLVEGTDYGKIPGTDKPTLLKPGAEKLVDIFRCTPRFKLMKSTEDFEKGFFNYVFRVQLFQRDADAVVAEGYGSANSREGRYRWRNSNRKCPKCSKEAIIQGKAEYGGGWLCFKKKGGCGAKFAEGDATIEGQASGQVENDDIATLANTILKMAKKRALVDGAIALGRCSDLFTQDVEDLVDHAPPEEPRRQAAPVKPAEQPKTSPAAAAAHQKVTETTASAEHQKALRLRAKRLWERLSKVMVLEEFKAWAAKLTGKESSVEWTGEDLDHLENAAPEIEQTKQP